MTLVVKLGGSVITEKDRRETVDEEALSAAAAALAEKDEPLVVVHGGGSFGHPNAADHGVTETEGTSDPAAVGAIHGAMVRLDDRVVEELRTAGLSPIPVHPLSSASRDAGGTLDFPGEVLRRSLAEGFVPVLHGDLVVHRSEGTTVLSGDEIVGAAVSAVEPDRVGLCTSVPGVLDDEGAVVESIQSPDDVPDSVGGSDATDVTGGMAGKVGRLLELGVPASVFGPDALRDFVAGESPGTRIGGD